ncbi:MAG TPA: cobalamin-binding protein, partial [Candidatus Binatia bacterium]|nr:cobalamin-binding protein [Candidatus Binatia bacterium]
VNGHAFFSRPGPRLVDGLELLAHIIHPEIFSMQVPSEHVQKVT